MGKSGTSKFHPRKLLLIDNFYGYMKGDILGKALTQLSVESRRQATDLILDEMHNHLTGSQLLELNKILNDEFNHVEFIRKHDSKSPVDIEKENSRFVKAFLNAKSVEGLSKRSLYKYENDIRFLTDYLIIPLSDVTSADIREFLTNYKKTHDISNVTLDGMRRTYSSFFNFLSNNGLIFKNPMVGIPKIKSNKLYKKAFSERELELLRYAIPQGSSVKSLRLKAMFELLLSSGIRISELASMKRSNINWTDLSFKIVGKGNKERKCYFNEKSKLAMQRYLKARKDLNERNKNKYRQTNDAMWVHDKIPYAPLGRAGIQRIIRDLGVKAKVPDVHAHRFRRTCATIYLNRGMPVEQVKILLGHESISTTQLYINVNEEAMRLNHERYTN